MTPTSDPHVPIRTCVGCGRRRPAGELVRVAFVAPDRCVVGRGGVGRGAWLCGADCVAPARKRRGFERAWRQPAVPDGMFATLAEQLAEIDEQQVAIGAPAARLADRRKVT